MTINLPLEILGIDHIGIIVPALEPALQAHLSLFGGNVSTRETLPHLEATVAFVPQLHAPDLEFIAPTSATSPLHKVVQSRGSGLHHLAYRVTNLTDSLARCQAANIRLIDTAPRNGARGHRIAFLHPASTLGILVELVEVVPGASGHV
jgi:methylmalonyl-CoA/ethylmalonyl-CoA epimerase